MTQTLPTETQTRAAFDRGEITLRIRSLPNQRTEGVYRLRRLLKCMLRGYGFRCESCLLILGPEELGVPEDAGGWVDDR